jgi:hypothetical protein
LGTIQNVEKSNFTYARNQGEKITLSSIVYLLKGGSKIILVDTGRFGCEASRPYARFSGSPCKNEKWKLSHRRGFMSFI